MIPIRDIARGKWQAILPALGVEARFLTNVHGPCPICPTGGVDRFRWDNKDGDGTYFCSQCGAGDGVRLVMLFRGWSFPHAVHEIEAVANFAPVIPLPKPTDPARVRASMNYAWKNSLPLEEVPAAVKWFERRLGFVPDTRELRALPRLRYQDGENGAVSFHPAILARVRDAEGRPINLHRTYLDPKGEKAAVETPRKLYVGNVPDGSAVRLYGLQKGAALGAGEGVETCLAAAALYQHPVWATLNAGRLKAWTPPTWPEIRLYGDNDSSFTGQEAVFAAAKRLKAQKFNVSVWIPPGVDTDFASLWEAMRSQANTAILQFTPREMCGTA